MLFLTFQGNDCVIGKYLSEANAGTYPCTPCPNGTTTKDDGANALTLCIPKPCGEEWTLDLLVPQDITASAGVTVFQGTVSGTLKYALTGTTTNSIVIKTAPGVTFVATAVVAIILEQMNVLVIPGIIRTATNKGLAVDADTGACAACPKGKRRLAAGAGGRAAAGCESCASGRFAMVPGLLKCVVCPRGRAAEAQDPKRVANQVANGFYECDECEIGFFAAHEKSASCTSCGAEKTTVAPEPDAAFSVTVCAPDVLFLIK